MFATSLPCRSIPLCTISYSRDWSLHPWESPFISDDLLQSFSQIGILHKPILLAKENGCFDILCGFKRLQFALSNAQVENVDCLIYSKDTKPKTLLDTILTDQSLSHPLSLAEKARFVDICTHFLSHEDIVSIYLERLQLKKNSSTIIELKNILQQDHIIISEIHAGRLQEKMVAELLRLAENPDRIALVQLFRALGMGDSKQKRFFTLIRDLAFRQDSTISAYLKTPAIDEILEHPVINVPQKIQHLNKYLQHQFCPMSSKADKDFARRVQELQLPSQCAISHSPSFEKDDITLSITFENFTDCARIVPKISNLLLINS
ncbi:MAG: hypothetical protein KJ630_14405 [Proteobacteria bacterium]|nr:hypothetical protein [Pseudomonadota bacterium]